MRKIVVCFERLNFEKSVRAVDEKQDISLLWPNPKGRSVKPVVKIALAQNSLYGKCYASAIIT